MKTLALVSHIKYDRSAIVPALSPICVVQRCAPIDGGRIFWSACPCSAFGRPYNFSFMTYRRDTCWRQLLWRAAVILVDVTFYDVPPWYLVTSAFMTYCRDVDASFYDVPPWYSLTSAFMTCRRDTCWRQLLWRTAVILVDVRFYDVLPWYPLTSAFMTCRRDTRWRQLLWRAAVILADVSFYDVLPWYLLMSVFMTYRRDSCWRQLFNPDNIACSSFIRNWTWCNFDNKRHDRIFWPSTFTMTFLDLRPVIFVITLSSTFLNTFAEVFHEKKTLFQF